LLSRDARVTIEIYSLSGRLINRLSPLTQSAGFQQIQWDGRDRKGRRLANGTYLYRIVATGGGQNAEFRGPLSIWR
jgi:flagellar hook assembly protein FlgD